MAQTCALLEKGYKFKACLGDRSEFKTNLSKLMRFCLKIKRN